MQIANAVGAKHFNDSSLLFFLPLRVLAIFLSLKCFSTGGHSPKATEAQETHNSFVGFVQIM